MSDKEASIENEQAEDNNAEKDNTNDAAKNDTALNNKTAKDEPLNSKKANIQKTVASKKAEKTVNSQTKNPISKLALFALVLSASAIGASALHYIWQQEQSLMLSESFKKERQQDILASQVSIKKALIAEFSLQLKQQLTQQQQTFTQQLKQVAQQAHQESEGGVTQLGTQLSAQVNQLEQRITQRDPSDWLIHEAEYLIRIAARTMWLERDTKAAIGLLKEADIRLSELKQPKFLPIRALINQDIAALALMPKLENQQAILSLMALNKQVTSLPFSGINLNEPLDNSAQENVELSNDINDWKKNLKKTWQKFLKDFITVRRREGTVEPLMTPEQQQHLKQNLSLKIQLAQWAASEQKADIYQQTLVDIQAWMNKFFDMEADINQKFYQALEQTKQHTIYYDYPNDLASLTAIKHLSNTKNNDGKPTSKTAVVKKQNISTEQADKSIEKPESPLEKNGDER